MKKKLLFLIFFIVLPFAIHAQVGIGVEEPHASAALEIAAKEKGLLISRMTLEEKNAIQNPAESLLIYQTDGEVGFYYFDGSNWVLLKNINQINADWNANSGVSQILNKPLLAKVGFTGDFNDLGNIPNIIYPADTSKMLLPYLTNEKLKPFLNKKASIEFLDNEILRAMAAEEQLSTDLQSEINRATTAEEVLQGSIETVKENLTTAKIEIETSIGTEKTRAIAAEEQLGANLQSEVTRATLEESVLQGNIETVEGNLQKLEVQTKTNAIGIQTNTSNITLKENSANKSTDGTLSDGTDTKFPTEKAVKTYVDGKLTTVNSETENLKTELDATQAGTGLASDGSYVANSAVNYISIATSLKDATEKLDGQAKTNADNIATNTSDINSLNTEVSQNTAIFNTLNTKVSENTSNIAINATDIGLKENSANKSTDGTLADETNTKFPTEKAVKTFVNGKVATLNTTSTNIQAELDATQVGSGLAKDGSYEANTATNYISTATSLKDVTEKLDAQAKNNANNISTNTTSLNTLDTKVAANTSDIQTNSTNITANTSDITSLNSTVSKNSTDISTNAINIALKENSVNKSTDGTLSDGTDTKFPTEKAVKTYVDGKLNTVNSTGDALQNELDATQTGVGLSESGSYMANTGTNYLKTVTSLKDADEKLDAQVKTNAVNISQNTSSIQINSLDIQTLEASIEAKASLASPDFTGTPKAPTADAGTSTSQIATTAFVAAATAAISNVVDLTSDQTIAGIKTFSSDLKVNGITIGIGNGAIASNTAFGSQTLKTNTGTENTATGNQALWRNLGGNRNTASGSNSLRQNTTGSENTAIGVQSLDSNTIGQRNTATGASALLYNNEGSDNTALGYGTLYNNKSSNNTAIGSSALENNSTGEGNTAVGYRALANRDNGSNNTAIGRGADLDSEGLTNATAIGYGARVGASNTIQLGNTDITDVITTGKLTTGEITLPNTDGTTGQVLSTDGSGTLAWNTPSTTATAFDGVLPIANGGTGSSTQNFVDLTSDQTIAGIKTFSSDVEVNGITIGRGNGAIETNTAFGSQSLASNTGIENTAAGNRALWKNSSGDKNTASGNSSLRLNTTGSENTATGFQSLLSNTTGQANTAIGTFALNSNKEGDYNIAVGHSALYYNKLNDNTALGYAAIGTNSTGEGNTAVGSLALNSYDNGSNNTAIGRGADLDSDGLTNATTIGYAARVGASNTIQLGNTDVTNVKTSGTLTAGTVTYPNTHNETDGQVLISNSSGVASWTSFSPSIAASSIINEDISASANIDQSKIAGLTDGLALKAPLASPTFTGTPLAPTAEAGTNTTQLATTAFVTAATMAAVTSSNFVDLTNNQDIGGSKKFTGDIKVASYITIGRGGGQSIYNTAFGTSALVVNTSEGILNTSIGFNTLNKNINGDENTALGVYALQENTASYNTAVGSRALQINTTGEYNVALGRNALFTNTDGSNNTAIGNGADVVTGDLTNATAIGNGAKVATSNTIQLGNAAVTDVKTSGTLTAGAVTYTGTDGTNGQLLTTDGSGNTSWVAPAAAIRDVADEFNATTSQTEFTLTQAPSANSKVKMYINGIRISNSAYSWTGTTLVYVPANNGNNTLTNTDRIQFDYFY
ncbi:hypothetical protein [Belliella aquatica]|uniref:Peptidase S74 domain-containing protein n=1 Tax=Belliella aquatica TaxID=1323734 RepID=A0ABQ1N493_9BACT|nr:hypothetical protein [Belliella aquatica]MCH7407366.1 hypothetical protein [Belliella aquatica]GGC52833.1 hypothetical protein GCM10010993_34110 [Belliella aquatica]